MKHRPLVLLAVSAVLLLTACSGSSSTTQTSYSANNVNQNSYITEVYGSGLVIDAAPAQMVSDGESLYLSCVTNGDVNGVFRCPLDARSISDGSLIYECNALESTGPVALGILDRDNLCVVIRGKELPGYPIDTSSWYNEEVVFQKIPTEKLTYWGEDQSYDSCSVILNPESNLPNIAGEWFFYTTALEDNETCQLRKRSIQSGEDVLLTEFSLGKTIHCLFGDDGKLIYYLNDPLASVQEIFVMDSGTGEITSSLSLEIWGLLGIHNDLLYYKADHPNEAMWGSAYYRIPLTGGEPELVCSATNVMTDGDAVNFTSDAIYTRSYDLLYRIPLDDLGKEDYPYTRLHICPDPNQSTPYPDCGLWVWNDTVWVYNNEPGEYNAQLKALSSSMIAELTGGEEIVPETPANSEESQPEEPAQEETTNPDAEGYDFLAGSWVAPSTDMRIVFDTTPPAPGLSGRIEVYNIDFDLLVYAPGNVLSTTFLYTKTDSNAELSLSFPDGWHSATLIYLAEYDEFHLWNDQGGKIVLERE